MLPETWVSRRTRAWATQVSFMRGATLQGVWASCGKDFGLVADESSKRNLSFSPRLRNNFQPPEPKFGFRVGPPPIYDLWLEHVFSGLSHKIMQKHLRRLDIVQIYALWLCCDAVTNESQRVTNLTLRVGLPHIYALWLAHRFCMLVAIAISKV